MELFKVNDDDGGDEEPLPEGMSFFFYNMVMMK